MDDDMRSDISRSWSHAMPSAALHCYSSIFKITTHTHTHIRMHDSFSNCTFKHGEQSPEPVSSALYRAKPPSDRPGKVAHQGASVSRNKRVRGTEAMASRFSAVLSEQPLIPIASCGCSPRRFSTSSIDPVKLCTTPPAANRRMLCHTHIRALAPPYSSIVESTWRKKGDFFFPGLK
jgi:hypothetical protein